jgi:sporulation protein YlmC with PRC-barrel domain
MDPGLVMRVSELLNLQVRTESGERLGRAHDLRAELTTRSLKVTGICVGTWGLLERLGFRSPESTGRSHAHDVVPWSAVLRADRRGIVVRDGTEPK